VPARSAKALLAAAGDERLAAPLRVESLQAVAALRGVTRVDDKAIAQLLGDRQPAVRRAVAEALAGAAAVDAPLTAALGDGDDTVAAAAGATLCRDVPTVPAKKMNAVEQRAAKLPAAARGRLRKLALADNVSLADRLELIPCLRVALQPEDQQTLDTLARRPPESLRRRAKALGGR
jgi:hypothetical protein